MTKNNQADRLLTENEAAELLGIKPQTLSVWRCTRRVELPYVKCGRAVRYRRSSIDQFIETNTVTA